MNESRELTSEEVRDRFFKHVWSVIDFWHKESRKTDAFDKLTGAVFSILAMLDGCAIDLPAFLIVPDPHPDDKDYHKDREENWWPENKDVKLNGEVSCRSMLHDYFHDYGRKLGYLKD